MKVLQRVAVALIAVSVLVVAVVAGVLLLRPGSSVGPVALTPPVRQCLLPGAEPYPLDPEQAANAAIIAAVGHKARMSPHAVTIALATAMQESKLINLPYGDRDSIGLFQQRPSQGWGTPAQVGDPVYAATKFYEELRTVRNWATIDVTIAAQKVQRSAYPTAYAKWEPSARAWARALTGERAVEVRCVSVAGGSSSRPVVERAMQRAYGSLPVRTPVPVVLGRSAANWLVTHAAQYGIAEVTMAGRTWRAADGRWTGDALDASRVRVTYVLATPAAAPA